MIKSMNKIWIAILALVICSCSYESNPVENEVGFFKGTIETYSGATNVVYLDGVNIETLPESKIALSDGHGKFSLDNVPSGTYILKMTKEDYYDTYSPVLIEEGKIRTDFFMVLPFAEDNTFPEEPYSPYPLDSGLCYVSDVTMFWRSSDADDNPIYFDIYLSQDYPPTECIAQELETDRLVVKGLITGKTYYWRVRVRDYYGASILGDIWQFRVKQI
ncbi:MAG: hypothetical protein B7C24_09785 [Bacteroidetes bacterium 4572_77]|nr:MAG: hypothetical protein B7C24_09785 [Bacteroidetes bacterium 4572_77]